MTYRKDPDFELLKGIVKNFSVKMPEQRIEEIVKGEGHRAYKVFEGKLVLQMDGYTCVVEYGKYPSEGGARLNAISGIGRMVIQINDKHSELKKEPF